MLGWGVLQFYFGKADSHVNEKLPHTIKNGLFPDFRAFCCRYFICRIMSLAVLCKLQFVVLAYYNSVAVV